MLKCKTCCLHFPGKKNVEPLIIVYISEVIKGKTGIFVFLENFRKTWTWKCFISFSFLIIDPENRSFLQLNMALASNFPLQGIITLFSLISELCQTIIQKYKLLFRITVFHIIFILLISPSMWICVLTKHIIWWLNYIKEKLSACYRYTTL